MCVLAAAISVDALLRIEDKGLAVGALTCCGVAFVCAHRYLVESTEIAGLSVVCALSYSASDSMIGLLVLFHY